MLFKGMEKLKDWPKVLFEFRRLMGKAPNSTEVLGKGSKYLALVRMKSQNTQRQAYIAMADNFLQAALHLFCVKMVQFPEGEIPDLPPDLYSSQYKCVICFFPFLSLLMYHQNIFRRKLD
jgi:hypothetical protein